MRFKSRQIGREYRALWKQNPSLWALLAWIETAAWDMFRKELTITSIRRDDDPPTPHNFWRAADCRVYRPEAHAGDELTWENWEELAMRANRKFVYGTTAAGRPTRCVHLLEKGERGSTEDHAHVQVPGGKWHGQRGEMA